MTRLPDHRPAQPSPPVCHHAAVLVCLEGGQTVPAEAELVGGRRRWSVGGVCAEGPRWWRGELSLASGPPAALDAGAAVRLQLSDGRAAVATVERSTGDLVEVTGLGAPPFDVP